MKTFSITYNNVNLEPYWNSLKDGTRPLVEFTSKDVYRKLNKETAILVLEEILDAPDKYLTIEGVKESFADHIVSKDMPDHVAEKIAKYYNGRKEILNRIEDLLEDESFERVKIDIPEELNGFTTLENDEDFEKIKQLEAYIEIETVL